MKIKSKLTIVALLLRSSLAFAAPGTSSITFLWDPSPDQDQPNFGGYRFYFGPVGTTTTNIVTLPVTNFFTVTNLPAGVPYWFAVTGRTTNNVESDFSNIVLYNLPRAPLILKPASLP